MKTAKDYGSSSSGSEPCLLAPSLLRDMQVPAGNAEKSSRLIILTECVKPYTWLVDSSCRVESSHIHAECTGSAEGLSSGIWVQGLRGMGHTATAQEGRWTCCTCVNTAHWIMTAER